MRELYFLLLLVVLFDLADLPNLVRSHCTCVKCLVLTASWVSIPEATAGIK